MQLRRICMERKSRRGASEHILAENDVPVSHAPTLEDCPEAKMWTGSARIFLLQRSGICVSSSRIASSTTATHRILTGLTADQIAMIRAAKDRMTATVSMGHLL